MRAAPLAAAALLLVACSGAGPAQAPEGAAPEPPRLLEAGTAPRAPLRLLPPNDGLERRRLEMRLRGSQEDGEAVGEMLGPPLGLELTARRRGEGEQLALSIEAGPWLLLPDELAPPATRLSMEAALAGVAGPGLEARLHPDLSRSALRIRRPPEEKLQARQLEDSLAQLFALADLRLPAEPVGVGARWSWNRTVRHSIGARYEQQTTATLLGRDAAGRLSLQLESSCSGPRQQVERSAEGRPVTMDVTRLEGRGTASLRFEAGELLPVELEVEGRWELHLVAELEGLAREVTLRQDFGLQGSRPASP